MHVVAIRTAGPTQRKLAENHAQTCMLAMSLWSKSWPACGWLLRLFESLLKNPVIGGTKAVGSRNSTTTASTIAETTSKASFNQLQPECSSSSQSFWAGDEQATSGSYDASAPTLSNIFQDLESQLPLPWAMHGNSGNNSSEMENNPFCVDQLDSLGLSSFPDTTSDFDASNPAFVSFIMNHFPQS